MATSQPNPLPATNAAVAPAPLSHDINIKITPETPLEASPPNAITVPPPVPASGSNADAKHEATGTGAGAEATGIKEKLALSTTAAAAGVASPLAATAAEEHTKEHPPQPRLSTTIPEDDLDFTGSVDSNNDIPSAETLKRIENYMVLDRDGRSHSFKSLYSGSHAARRVLVIFVRHFFCGQCQEYLRQLSASITPEALLRLPVSTFITVVGCGDPGLIEMYAAETGCSFPIYADPRRKLYEELGMIRTLALGQRPAYISKGLLKSSIESIFQGLKQVKNGLATKAGDARQIGGEFLFEPFDLQSPVSTPWTELDRQVGFDNALNGNAGDRVRSSGASLDGKFEGVEDLGEEKRVTWCHRMKTTRDHAEIPELMEVLGLDGQGMPIKDKKRWSRALEQRKGTGLSMASQISAMKAEAGEA